MNGRNLEIKIQFKKKEKRKKAFALPKKSSRTMRAIPYEKGNRKIWGQREERKRKKQPLNTNL